MSAELAVTMRQRLGYWSLNATVFGVCYVLANAFALQQGVQRSAALAWDACVPFVAWMIIPYGCSGLFLTAAFVLARSPAALRVLNYRILLTTAIASLVFVLLPLRFSGQRPAIESPWLASLFDLLAAVDLPYNQLPSLHAAYCAVLWPALRDTFCAWWLKTLLAVGLALTVCAALLTFQHHVLDVVLGLVLGWACVRAIAPGRKQPFVALYYFVAGCVVMVIGRYAWNGVITLYLVLSLWLVSLAYARGNRHFLHKSHGQFPLWVWLVYAPYLLGYRLTWLAVVWRERHQPVVRQLTSHLWSGRRLGASEAHLLPPNCKVFDVANELPVAATLRPQTLRHDALLDLVTPPAEVVQDLVQALSREIDAGHNVYLHCAMGYGRCKVVANQYLLDAKS